jgi:hypothetical protein
MLSPITLPFTDSIKVGDPSSISAIRVANESAYSLRVEMEGNGGNYPIDAFTGDVIYVKQYPGWSGAITITAQLILTNIGGAPSTKAQLTIFGVNETVSGTYPIAYNRLTNTGNVVTTSGGSVAQLVNDGNPAGTQIIEATVSGDVASAVSMTNDGIIVIGTAANKGSFTLIGPISIDNGAIVSNGSGQLTITGTVKATQFDSSLYRDSAGNDGMVITAGTLTRIQSATQVVAQVPAGSTQFAVTNALTTISNGFVANNGETVNNGSFTVNSANVNFTNIINANSGLNLIENFLHGITSGTFTSTGSNQTINHGMAGTPFAVLCECDDTTSTTTHSAFSYTSTNFTFRANNTGVVIRWVALR